MERRRGKGIVERGRDRGMVERGRNWNDGSLEYGSCGMMEPSSHIGMESYQSSHTGAHRAHCILAQGRALGRHDQKNCRLKACCIRSGRDAPFFLDGDALPIFTEIVQPWMIALQMSPRNRGYNPICKVRMSTFSLHCRCFFYQCGRE